MNKLLTRAAKAKLGVRGRSLSFSKWIRCFGLLGFPFADIFPFSDAFLYYINHILILRALYIQVFGLFLNNPSFLVLKNKGKPLLPSAKSSERCMLHSRVFSGLVELAVIEHSAGLSTPGSLSRVSITML